jgi:hypothetical protein
MASQDYIKWLGLLEERVATTTSSKGFALPSPASTVHVNPSTSDKARAGVGRPSSGHRLRTKVTANAETMRASGDSLMQARQRLAGGEKRPKSQGWQDWGSAPLAVEYTDVAASGQSGGWLGVETPASPSKSTPAAAWRPPSGAASTSGPPSYPPPSQVCGHVGALDSQSCSFHGACIVPTAAALKTGGCTGGGACCTRGDRAAASRRGVREYGVVVTS